ncbi:hypothetical protein JTB14_028015 [Gonioctena quinquepunctata]|nr:hypothetical protein JTB14_028015 [Gonioctena quinquepunctata]
MSQESQVEERTSMEQQIHTLINFIARSMDGMKENMDRMEDRLKENMERMEEGMEAYMERMGDGMKDNMERMGDKLRRELGENRRDIVILFIVWLLDTLKESSGM